MTELVTDRLLLRRAREEDVNDLHAVFSNPQAMRYWSTPPHERLEQTAAWLASMVEAPPESSDDYVLTLNGRVVGKAGFWRLPQVGFILHPDLWGQGYAREALSAVLIHVFATRELETATADVDPRNGASLRLLARLGFRETGRRSRTWRISGVWSDSVYLALSRDHAEG